MISECTEISFLAFQLLPVDAKIKEYSQKEVDEAKAYVRKLQVVNLAEKSEESKEAEVVKVDLVGQGHTCMKNKSRLSKTVAVHWKIFFKENQANNIRIRF